MSERQELGNHLFVYCAFMCVPQDKCRGLSSQQGVSGLELKPLSNLACLGIMFDPCLLFLSHLVAEGYSFSSTEVQLHAPRCSVFYQKSCTEVLGNITGVPKAQ